MSIVLQGSTSGSVTLQEPAVAGTTVIDLPATSGTMVVTGGAQTVQFAAGSASTPSITTTGDTNTGIFFPAADTIAFSEGGAESMRIDSSGNLLINCTVKPSIGGAGSYGFATQTGLSVSGVPTLTWRSNTTSATDSIYFYSSTSLAGYIRITGSSTSYVTSSDYRLKENVQPMVGALAKVQSFKPCTYTWKQDGESGQGFIAHELAEVCPDAVCGEKDAVDADGNIKPQGIDTSYLVATLTAAIQELNAKVDAQAVRIAELEGAK
jgi:hypothetical protein